MLGDSFHGGSTKHFITVRNPKYSEGKGNKKPINSGD